LSYSAVKIEVYPYYPYANVGGVLRYEIPYA